MDNGQLTIKSYRLYFSFCPKTKKTKKLITENTD